MTFLACQALGRDRTCYAFGFSGEEGMKAVVIALALLGAGAGQAVNGAEEDPALVRARKLLKENILIDGHNDLPWAIREYTQAPRDVEAYDLRVATLGDTDIERLRAGGLGAQFWSVYIPGEDKALGYARVQLEQIDIARRVIAKYPEHLALALTAADVEREFARGRIASLLGMEGGHAIENSLGALRSYYDLGVRYMTLTHGVTLDWADAAGDTARHGGLTRFGEEVLREMNRLGMLVDLSHVAPSTMADALDASAAPVIFSHSSARALNDVPRNVPDDILARVPANGGIVMVTFVAGFISADAAAVLVPAIAEFGRRSKGITDLAELRRVRREIVDGLDVPRPSIGEVADHVEHVARVAGRAHVGIGSDFDGNSFWPEDLHDVSCFPNLFAELVRRGWSDDDLVALAGGNVLRVMREAESVARAAPPAMPG
jgi:membrane dipeptidase